MSCRAGNALAQIGIKGRSVLLQTETLPNLWKTSTIIPVPEKSHPSELNHYRPVALTIISKCFEKLVLTAIEPAVSPQLDHAKNHSTASDDQQTPPSSSAGSTVSSVTDYRVGPTTSLIITINTRPPSSCSHWRWLRALRTSASTWTINWALIISQTSTDPATKTLCHLQTPPPASPMLKCYWTDPPAVSPPSPSQQKQAPENH